MSHFQNTSSILSMKNKSIGSSGMDSNEKCFNNQSKSNQYEIPLKQYVSQQQLFRWRQNTHHPILRITAVNQLVQKQTVSLRCQKIVNRMDEIRMMKIEEIIYSMSQMLLGYQSLLMRLGWVCVEEKMVGVNQKGELLLWVNQNPVKNTPGGMKLINEKDIVDKITQILQQKCSLSSNIFFKQIKHLPKTFSCYLEYLVQFKLTHKLKIVPKINVVGNNNMYVNTHHNININTHHNNNININTHNNNNNKSTFNAHQKINNFRQKDLQKQLKLQSSPLITSTSVNYIPTISGGEVKQQLFTSFNNSNNNNNNYNQIKTMHNINNSQSQSQFIGINRLHSVHSLFPLPVANHQPHQYQYEQKQRKQSKTTSIIFNPQNNVNTSTIISQQNYNNSLMNNNNNTVNNIIEQQKYQQNQQQQSVKSLSKINFSYSQKRNDNLYTPRQSTFLREYTSDRRLPALGRIQSQTNQQIREFTLMDDNNKKDVINNHVQKMTKSANDIKKSAMSSNNNGNNNKNNKKKGSRSIVPSYTISYNPITDSIILQNEIQLKKSSISSLSQRTIKSQQQHYQQIDENMIELTSRCPNKSSMTTNHRSATSNQYQSMDSKCSNVGINYKNNSIIRNNSTNNDLKELDILNRRNMNMFASNSSHRVSYSMVKDSFVENDTLMKNTKSILVNTSQQLGDNSINNNFTQHNNRQFIGQKSLMNPNIKSTLTTSLFAKQPVKNIMMNNSQERFHQQQQLNANNNNNNNNSMYTFGGLIIPNVQDNVSTNNNNNKDIPLQLKANKNINNNGYTNYANANSQQQQLEQQKQLFDNKKLTNLSPTIIASSTIVDNYQHHTQLQQTNHYNNLKQQQQSKIKLSTTSVKSIQQLYKNINAKSEKKSIIVVSNNNSNNNSNVKDNSYNSSQCEQKYIQRQQQQENYNIHLSPVAKHQSPVTPIKQSHIINYNNNISGNTNNNNISLMNNHNNHFKKNHLQYLLSPTTNNHTNHHDLKHSQQLQTSQIIQQPQQQLLQQQSQQQEFDYNQWRGITGLLNQSNVHQLKQSIHCGPQIRAAPLNIKLQLLDKFGREIGHSILPATQNNGLMMPGTQNNGFTNSCVRSIFIDEQ